MTIEIDKGNITVNLYEYEKSDYGTGKVKVILTIDHENDQISFTTTSGSNAHNTESLSAILNAIQDCTPKETSVVEEFKLLQAENDRLRAENEELRGTLDDLVPDWNDDELHDELRDELCGEKENHDQPNR